MMSSSRTRTGSTSAVPVPAITGPSSASTIRWPSAWRIGADLTAARHTYDSRIELLGVNEDIEGNDIDTAPRVFGSARVQWDPDEWAGFDPLAELEWIYMDEYYLEPTNTYQYDGHSLLNLRLQAAFRGGVTTSLRVTNLLDEDYAERADFGFWQLPLFRRPAAGGLASNWPIAGSSPRVDGQRCMTRRLPRPAPGRPGWRSTGLVMVTALAAVNAPGRLSITRFSHQSLRVSMATGAGSAASSRS